MMIIPRPPSDDEDDGFANLSREQIERLARERYAEEKVSLLADTVPLGAFC